MGQEGRELRGDLDSSALNKTRRHDLYPARICACGRVRRRTVVAHHTRRHRHVLGGSISAAVRAAILQDEQLRACLPLAFNRGHPEVLVSQLKGTFRQMADEGFLRGVVEQYLDEIVATHALDISGQITDYFQPKPLALADTVGPRRGIVLQTHAADDFARLNYGGRTITFPAFFREALEFALHHTEFVIVYSLSCKMRKRLFSSNACSRKVSSARGREAVTLDR